MNRSTAIVVIAGVLLAVALLRQAQPPALAAPTPAVRPTQDKDQSKFEMTPEEKQILELTNEARKKENLPPLKPSPVLFKVARAHTANMARQQKLEHVLDNKTPFQRIKEAGYAYRFAGENVAFGNYPIPQVFEGWMESKPHRANILNKNFTEIGLGRVVDKKGDAYYTQVFGTPRPQR